MQFTRTFPFALLLLLIAAQPIYAFAVPTVVKDYKVGDRSATAGLQTEIEIQENFLG